MLRNATGGNCSNVFPLIDKFVKLVSFDMALVGNVCKDTKNGSMNGWSVSHSVNQSITISTTATDDAESNF